MVNDMAPRVDFKAVRARADFPRVLASYGIELKKDGSQPGQFKALCPFHEDTKPSLKVNTDKNLFHCFPCEAKGNVIDFVMQMDDIDVRAAALKVQSLSGQGDTEPAKAKRRKTRKADAPSPQPKAETLEEELDGVPYNKVLTFNLNLTLDDELTDWLDAHGLDETAIETFGLGRASKRSKTIGDRLAIPLHNKAGELIGYCGRHIGDYDADDEPKYRMPKGFRKEIELFNLHRLSNDEIPALFVFESYLSVMRHHPHIASISPYGRSISERQVALIKELDVKQIVVVADGDEPGYLGAAQIAGQLAPHFWVRVLNLNEGVKPHHLDWEELRPLLVNVWESL